MASDRKKLVSFLFFLLDHDGAPSTFAGRAATGALGLAARTEKALPICANRSFSPLFEQMYETFFPRQGPPSPMPTRDVAAFFACLSRGSFSPVGRLLSSPLFSVVSWPSTRRFLAQIPGRAPFSPTSAPPFFGNGSVLLSAPIFNLRLAGSPGALASSGSFLRRDRRLFSGKDGTSLGPPGVVESFSDRRRFASPVIAMCPKPGLPR